MASNSNYRIVLPQSSCPPLRRVVAPSAFSRMTTDSSQLKHSTQRHYVENHQPSANTCASSKNALSAKEYKEYLEDMELKIRYMKNDIEFKQSQIQKKAIPPASSVKPGSHLVRPPVHRKQAFSSSYATKLPAQSTSKQLPVSKTTASYSSSHMAPRFTYVKKTHSNLVKVNTTSALPVKCARESNTETSVVLASSQHGPLRISVSPQTLPISTIVNTIPSLPDRSPSQPSRAAIALSSVSDSQLCTTTAPAITSVFQRLGGFSSLSSPKPIYVSPSKNQAIWSHSSVCTDELQSWSKRQAQLSTALSDASKPKMLDTASKSLEASSLSTRGEGSCSTVSRYKLVKTNSTPTVTPTSSAVLKSSPAVSGSTAVLQPSKVSTLSSPTITTDSVLGFHRVSPHCKTLRKKIPKLQISAKMVSKYKMKRLSPNSTSKIAPQLFRSQSTQTQFLLSRSSINPSCDIHKLDRRFIKTPSSANHINTAPPGRLPKLEIVMAAKLVSKYRLKRLTPTSNPKLNPSLLNNASANLTSAYPSTPFLPKKQVLRNLKHQKSIKGPFTICKRNTTPLKKSAHYLQQTELFPKRHDYVLDRRTGVRTETNKQDIIHSTGKNRHKLDHRQKDPSPHASGKVYGKISRRRQSKHHWVSKAASPSTPKSRPTKQNVTRSRFKWRKSSSEVRPNGVRLNNSRFKWSSKRHFVGPSTWRSGNYSLNPQNHRQSPWMTKSNLVMIRGVVYRSNYHTTSLKKANNPIPRGKDSSRTSMKLITLRGAHFHTDSRGKKLCRAGLAQQNNGNVRGEDSRKTQGFHGKVDETTILAASRVVHRSMAVAAAKFRKNSTKWRKKKQHCIFFGRFGKCHRGDKCHYVHDPEKVAVCTRFLRGKCDKARCQFSHSASVHKMPVCLHYLQGLCSRDGCPYLHVRVNPEAPVCKDFCNGYCALGEKCKKLHSLVCPSFAVTGHCLRGESCSLLHRRVKKEPARKESNQSARQRGRKRRKSSTAEAGPIKKRVTTSLRVDSNKSVIKNGGESAGDGSSHTLSPAHSNQSSSLSRPTLEDSFVLPEIGVDVKTPEFGPTTSAAGVTRNSAPLASQPSFISLLADSPLASKPEMSSTSPVSYRDLNQTPCIKPLFVAQKLSQPHQAQLAALPGKSTSCTLSESVVFSRAVPKPGFLMSREAKANSMQ
ncbi:Zinc finger ccch domain-containing protein 3 [Plakobranchus ocellatus]|uniref:Zinc finger CCCH domain-containing protein 3 n=1 Tax=Plakobranchus ocellatus TaxID=259542 RepID=A0AAV3Z9C4_9GAST|nr:Zinc finger ccch domain-containing protein 3 [Plakobranchus ocellatus]